MLRSSVLSLAVLGLLTGTGRAQDTTKKPAGPPPRLVVLTKVDRTAGTFIITEARLVQVRVLVEREVDEGGGVKRVRDAVTKYVREEYNVLYTLKGAQVQTAGGKKLTTEDALNKLSAGSLVLLSTDFKAVDPAYLRVLKNET